MDFFVTCDLYPKNNRNIENLLSDVNTFVSEKSRDYLFNYETPIFYIRTKNGIKSLRSRTNITDNITDEWFITKLVFELTNHFPMAASLQDSDGHFLLIQAADEVPDSLSPQHSDNSHFIVNGKMRFLFDLCRKYVPRFEDGSELDFETRLSNSEDEEREETAKGKIPLKEALNAIWKVSNLNKLTKKENRMTHLILEKFNEHENFQTSDIGLNLHNCAVRVSRKVAVLLSKFPKLVTESINAYCHRSLQENNFLRKKEFEITESNAVFKRQRFTRFLFAKLDAAKTFKSDFYFNEETLSQSEEMGLKLCLGFEILYARGVKSQELLKKHGIDILEKNSNINELLLTKSSNISYLSSALRSCADALVKKTKNYADDVKLAMIKFVIDSLDMEEIEFEKLKDCSQIKEELEPDDDTKWMEITEADLNNILLQKETDSTSFEKMFGRIESFLKSTSGFEGVEDWEFDKPENMNESLSDEYSGTSDDEFDSFTNAMDQELKNTKMAESFDAAGGKKTHAPDGLDIDFNMAKNLMASFEEQEGGPGPASNFLSSLNYFPESLY